jgi:hypothetical protein
MYRDTGTSWEFVPLSEIPYGVYLETVTTDTSITGDGTPGNPLAVVPSTGVYIEAVSTNDTLTGDGTTGSPLSVKVPGSIIKSATATLPKRSNLKIIGAAISDDSAADATVVTMSGGGHTIKSSHETLPQRANLKIVGATVTDDSGADATLVTITGGSSGGSGSSVEATVYPLSVYTTDTNVNWNTLIPGGASSYYLLSSGAQNDEINWVINLPAGIYRWDLFHFMDNNRGIYSLYIDGSLVGAIDGNAGSQVRRSSVSGISIDGGTPIEVKIKMATTTSSNYFGTIFSTFLTRTGGSGGGSSGLPAYLATLPDCPPATPNAMDDEFDGTTLNPVWTVVGTALPTIAVVNGTVNISAPGTTERLKGIIRPAPAGSWKFRCHAYLENYGSPYTGLGFVAQAPSTGFILYAGVMYHPSFGYLAPYLGRFATFDGSPTESAVAVGSLSRDFFLELEYDGSNYILRGSASGKYYAELNRCTSSWYPGVGDPANIGIVIHQYLNPTSVSFDWFRRVS